MKEQYVWNKERALQREDAIYRECVMNSFQKVSSIFKTIELRTKISFEVVEE